MEITYMVHPLIGKFCTSYQQGIQLYEFIHRDLRAGQHTHLDFDGVSVCTPTFFSGCMDLLHEDISLSVIRDYLHTHNLNTLSSKAFMSVVKGYKPSPKLALLIT